MRKFSLKHLGTVMAGCGLAIIIALIIMIAFTSCSMYKPTTGKSGVGTSLWHKNPNQGSKCLVQYRRNQP